MQTLTIQQELACQARQIERWTRGNRSYQMSVLIALVANWSGQTLTCQALQTLAAQFSCLPPNQQLPALIALMNEVVSAQIVPPSAGFVYEGNYGGNPPPFTPQNGSGVATDTSTGQFWVWWNNQWN